MIIILFGPPGVGKGTQADLLCKKYNLKHISTGALLRHEVLSDTPLGRDVDSIMKGGGFPDDSIIMELVARQLGDLKKGTVFKGVVLDGVPRTVVQARLLEGLLAGAGLKIEALIILEASEKFLLDRLEKRQVCVTCGRSYHQEQIPPVKEGMCDECQEPLSVRSDDTTEAIKKRLELYKEQTEPVLAYYEKSPFVHKINACGPVQEVFSSINHLLCREKLDSCDESL